MLKITIPSRELWDEEKNEFYCVKEQTLQLEHSLVSVQKWESEHLKPFFLRGEDKTFEETMDYVRCMTITQNVDPYIYNFLTKENIKEISDYINLPKTATTFFEMPGQRKGAFEQPTAELIYYWMIALNIPFECQKWHFDRLITLIRVCSEKNQPEKKMSAAEIRRQNAAINEARKKKYNTRG